MLEILKDNEELLLDIHEVEISENSENIIELYSNLLKESKNGKKPQLLEFLKNICTFKGKGISVNQEKVFEYLFDNKEIYNSIIVPIRVEENSMFVEVSADIYVQLERCFNFGLIIDHECIIIYITKLIELFANMCLSRNFVCINILSDIFSADLILKIIRNENITPELRAAFSKLMLTVYIDIPPREEVIKPELIKVLHLENRDNKITIPKTNSKTSSRNNSDNTKSTFKYIEVSLNDNDFLDVYKEEA